MSFDSANHAVVRTVVAVILVLGINTMALAGFSDVADGQTSILGTADFRDAPTLAPGQYLDRIVTGDAAWYSLMYTNGTPFRFEVSLPDASPTGADDVRLEARFIAPTLDVVSGPAPIVSGEGVEYPTGLTNLWFLQVSLTSSGPSGVEYDVLIEVEGVESTTLEDCRRSTSCTFDDELADLDARLESARVEVNDLEQQPQTAAIERQIENLQGFIDAAETLGPATQARLQRAEATMARLCAPESTCTTFPDQGSTTPLIGWILGGGVLAAGAARAVAKIRSKDEPEPEPPVRTRLGPS